MVYEGMNELSLFEEKLHFNMRHLVDAGKTGFDNTVLFVKMLDKSIKDEIVPLIDRVQTLTTSKNL